MNHRGRVAPVRVGPRAPWLQRRLVWLPAAVAAVWLALLLAAGVPEPVRAEEADPVALARSFGAAWNAHDVEAVVAHFASDAVVREPRLVWETAPDGSTVTHVVYGGHLTGAHDVYGTGAYGSPFTLEGGAVVWRGTERIREWAYRLFALRHRAEADGYTADAERVTWRYRAHVDHYQLIVGVPAAEGAAAMTARGGRITELELTPAAGSLRLREAAVRAALSRAAATACAGATERVTSRPPAREAGVTAPDSIWPLAAAGLGAAAGALSVVRGRARRAQRPGA